MIESTPLMVFLRDDGTMTIDGKAVDAAEVRLRAGTDLVLLQGSENIQYAHIQKAMTDLRGLNLPIGLMSDNAGQQ